MESASVLCLQIVSVNLSLVQLHVSFNSSNHQCDEIVQGSATAQRTSGACPCPSRNPYAPCPDPQLPWGSGRRDEAQQAAEGHRCLWLFRRKNHYCPKLPRCLSPLCSSGELHHHILPGILGPGQDISSSPLALPEPGCYWSVAWYSMGQRPALGRPIWHVQSGNNHSYLARCWHFDFLSTNINALWAMVGLVTLGWVLPDCPSPSQV